jgi:hypothetical protein
MGLRGDVVTRHRRGAHVATTFEVVRSDLARFRIQNTPSNELREGQARIAVRSFGFSANNITYGVFGDLLQYWQFFPATMPEGDDVAEWGRIPVWGFGEVIETRSADVTVGERLFGYLPMSDELVIEPGRAGERTVADVSLHRSGLPAAYNSFQRCAQDAIYREDREGLQMLLYPLYFTAFVIDDFLLDHDDFAADQVVISSASAKTAIGTAFLVHQRGQRVVGLTSPANAEFVRSLGVYDDVVLYGNEASLASTSSIYVDVAGNRDVLWAVHEHLGANLVHSMVVGGTHWSHEAEDHDEELPGPRPQFLFAPSQIEKRTRDWGPDGLNERIARSWDDFAEFAPRWLSFEWAIGAEAISDIYLATLEGDVDPRVGVLCSFSELPA